MNRHSVFLRGGCTLPNRLNPLRKPLENDWALIVNLVAPIFSTMICRAGWNFTQTQDFCVRRGFGITRKNATDRAVIHALDGIAQSFNAAELESVRVDAYLGFHVATVTLQPRLIYQ
jgi:hypothetical protein